MTKIKCPVCEHTNDSARKECAHCGAPLPKVRVQSGEKPAQQQHAHGSSQSTFRKGQVVANRYTILDLVGKGGMGCIYLVTDNTLKERVALKTLLPQYLRDKMVVERFFNEARIARQLSHPNIVRVHDIGMADQVLYISMEYLTGKSLRGMLDELLPGERLPVKDTLKVMIDLCTALEYAHQYTVHRDLKPENIMVTPEGTLKLMDFGISKLMTTNKLTATAVVMGTPHYMPPEQFKDSSTVDARADIYSIGVILYEMLTGNLPTGVSKPASQILRDVPPALDPIIAKCVEPDPNNRYASVTELKHALSEVLELLRGGTLESKKSIKPASSSDGNLARKAIGGVLIAAVLLLTAVGVMGLERRRAQAIADLESTATLDPNESIERQWRNRYKEASDLIALAEQRTANRDKSDVAVSPIFDRINLLRDAAAGQQDPKRATLIAHQVLQCYSAIIAPQPADQYLFVLPGDVGDDAFYFPLQPAAATSNYYEAEAYAAEHNGRLPSRAEWKRAFALNPGATLTTYPEWTRDIAAGEPDENGMPTFGNDLFIVSVSSDQDGNILPPVLDQTARFYAPGQQIGFRCVLPIDTSADAVRALMNQ
ncbi:MAG: serine/threonine protein kinase [Candidatus Hydrogenedentes bacterium]|nr:serine/threonine protein kinase [Candidatus Hydrogenedentota bacterium]